MNVVILAAGAGGMYCGSCMRDNTLASALKRLGHTVLLAPLYTPLKSDTPAESVADVFYGGVNVYLQHASRLFRRTPRFIDWLFDRPWLLKWAGSRGASTNPATIGPFVLSILRGEEGPQVKELRRLLDFLKRRARPDIVVLPNTMFIGVAKMLRESLGVPVVCQLTGEDIFLDAMAEPHKSRALAAMRARARDIDRFIATSHYYADHVSSFIGLKRTTIEVVLPAVAAEVFSPPRDLGAGQAGGPPKVGYFARICPEKGLDRLVEAFALLRKRPGMEGAQLHAAGYMGDAHRAWRRALEKRIAALGLKQACHLQGEVDLAGKQRFLDSIDVLCVPTAYPDPKGTYVLEALARRTPYVQPAHGVFPELHALTGGGVLAPPGDAEALASALAELLGDPARRRALADAGHAAVKAQFMDTHLAQNMLRVFEEVIARSGLGAGMAAGSA